MLGGAAAFGLTAFAPPLAAAPFASSRISVVVRGQGPDAILIHGVDSSRDVWSGTIAALPGYRWHLVQISGFAGVPAGGNAQGRVVAPAAAEIARYIAEAKLIRPAIIGHSMGGTIALMLAARYPGRVGKAMVVDMLPAPAGLLGGTASGLGPLADRLSEMFTATPEGRNTFASLMTMFGGSANAAPDRRSDPDVTARALQELARIDMTPELAKIAVPLTVIYATPAPGGSIDPARVAQNYRDAYAQAKAAKLVGVANSGHMIMYDRPTEFRAALRTFLATRP